MTKGWRVRWDSWKDSYLLFWAKLVVRARRPCVVCITGSVGKTSTKEAVAGVLMHPDAFPYVGLARKTMSNRNGIADVALLFLRRERRLRTPRQRFFVYATMPLRALALATFAPYPRVFVVEYAAWALGSIQRRVDAVPPTIGIVSAIGPAHLDTFESIENIRHEKGIIARTPPPEGLVVLGADNEYAAGLAGEARAPVVLVPGRGRVFAEGAARAVGRHLGVPEPVIERALAELPAVAHRLDVVQLDEITLIDDCYNANPLSMQLGLDTLAATAHAHGDARRVAVLGTMAELGSDAARYHRELAPFARARAEVIIGVGELAWEYGPDYWFANSTDCSQAMRDIIRPGDCVLVKGSHSVKLSLVTRTLREQGALQVQEFHQPRFV